MSLFHMQITSLSSPPSKWELEITLSCNLQKESDSTEKTCQCTTSNGSTVCRALESGSRSRGVWARGGIGGCGRGGSIAVWSWDTGTGRVGSRGRHGGVRGRRRHNDRRLYNRCGGVGVGQGAWAFLNGQGGCLGHSVDLASLGDLGGVWAVRGELVDDLGGGVWSGISITVGGSGGRCDEREDSGDSGETHFWFVLREGVFLGYN